MHKKKYAKQQGFSLIEVMVTAATLTISGLAINSGVSALQKQSAKNNAAPQFKYWEEAMIERIAILVQNFGFWTVNITDGCKYAGDFLNVKQQDPADKKTTIFKAPGDLYDYKKDYIAKDFAWILNFTQEGNNTRGWHNMFFVRAPIDENPWNVRIRNWYTANKSTHFNDQIVTDLRKCLNPAYAGNFTGLTPGADFENHSNFAFCLSLTTTLTPDDRKSILNSAAFNGGIGGSTANKPMPFNLAHIEVTTIDLISNTPYDCKNRNGETPSSVLTNHPTRSAKVSVRIHSIDDVYKPYEEQTRSTYTTSFYVSKPARALVNCFQRINVADPAWIVECTRKAASDGTCPDPGESTDPSNKYRAYPFSTINSANLCAPYK